MIESYDTQLGQTVSSISLYDFLGLPKDKYSRFIKSDILENPYASMGVDYLPKMASEQGRGNFRKDYHIQMDFAIKLCMATKSPKGEEVRTYLLSLLKKVENKDYITRKEAGFALLLINTLQFEEFQIDAQRMHHDRFRLTNKVKGNIHKLFADYRNDLLDINNDRLKHAMIEHCKAGLIPIAKAKNIRRRIYMLDKYRLIRDAVVDLLVSKGVNTWEALQFAEVVKEMAEHAGIEIKIKDENTLFESKIGAPKPSDIKMLN